MQKQPAVTFGCAEDKVGAALLLVDESHFIICDESESFVEGATFIGSVK